MHHFYLALYHALLFTSIVAGSPGLKRAVEVRCNDKCERAVLNNAKLPASKRKPGCFIFLERTYYECPSTVVETPTSTFTTTLSTGTTTVKSTIRTTETNTTTRTLPRATTTVTKTSYQETISVPSSAQSCLKSTASAAPREPAEVIAVVPGRALDARGAHEPVKRQPCTPTTIGPASAVPTWLVGSCPDTAAVSSACTCIGHTTTGTLTIPSGSGLVTSTGPAVHETATVYGNTVISGGTTLTTTVTTTTATKATRTVTNSVVVETTCPDTRGLTCQTAESHVTTNPKGVEFSVQGRRFRHILNPNNAGNSNPSTYPPVTSTHDGALSLGEAAQACANAVVLNHNNTLPLGYRSFDLHYFCLRNQWQCIHYYGPQYNASLFTIPNQDVVVALLYSVQH